MELRDFAGRKGARMEEERAKAVTNRGSRDCSLVERKFETGNYNLDQPHNGGSCSVTPCVITVQEYTVGSWVVSHLVEGPPQLLAEKCWS